MAASPGPSARAPPDDATPVLGQGQHLVDRGDGVVAEAARRRGSGSRRPSWRRAASKPCGLLDGDVDARRARGRPRRRGSSPGPGRGTGRRRPGRSRCRSCSRRRRAARRPCRPGCGPCRGPRRGCRGGGAGRPCVGRAVVGVLLGDVEQGVGRRSASSMVGSTRVERLGVDAAVEWRRLARRPAGPCPTMSKRCPDRGRDRRTRSMRSAAPAPGPPKLRNSAPMRSPVAGRRVTNRSMGGAGGVVVVERDGDGGALGRRRTTSSRRVRPRASAVAGRRRRRRPWRRGRGRSVRWSAVGSSPRSTSRREQAPASEHDGQDGRRTDRRDGSGRALRVGTDLRSWRVASDRATPSSLVSMRAERRRRASTPRPRARRRWRRRTG